MVASATSAALAPSRLKALFAMHQTADEQAQSDDAVEDDHDCGEHRVARQSRRFLPAGGHQRYDERNLDQCDRECQHQGAERLPHTMGDDFRMMDRGEYAAGETESCQSHEESAADPAEHGGRQNRHGKRRSADRPQGHLRAGFHAGSISQVY